VQEAFYSEVNAFGIGREIFIMLAFKISQLLATLGIRFFVPKESLWKNDKINGRGFGFSQVGI